jgi:O-antigen/teichoic acid export membrane protein
VSAEAARPTGSFRLADGVVRGFAAELLLLPTGLVTAAVLSRVLGPSDYGLFTLAATFATWVSWTTTSLLSRAAVKFVGEAHDDWRPAAASVFRWRLSLGLGSALLVLAAADLIARALHSASLAPYLRVFAIDLLLFNLARAYREVLTGRGRFREVAMVSMVRWTARMVLIVALVWATRSVMAAVAGSVGATLVELLVARSVQPIPLRERGGIAPAQMWGVAAPLMLYGTTMQLFGKVDLLALSALGGTARDAGLYGAAQNLAVAPGLFALAIGPLLLATLARMRRIGHTDEARLVGRAALRVTFVLVPFAALVAGTATELVHVVFGASFDAAGPLLALLFASAVAIAVMAVAVAIITAADHQRVVSLLGVVVLAGALVGHATLIPRFGASGAALVTTVAATAGALVSVALVHRTWRVHAYGTLLRATLIAAPAYWAASALATPGAALLALELVVLSVAVLAAFVLTGELDADERRRWLVHLPFRRVARVSVK